MHHNSTMILTTKNGHRITSLPLRSLSNGYLLVFAQDRLVVARIDSPNYCNEVESMDALPFYQGYLQDSSIPDSVVASHETSIGM